MGRAMRKRVFGHMQTAQSDQSLHCPLTESLDTIECFNVEPMFVKGGRKLENPGKNT